MPPFPCTLLVDDDDTTNFLNRLLLKRMGFTATPVALNGQQALALLDTAADYPALILLDLKMPLMNGIDFLHAYTQQELPAHQPAPVIVMLTTSLNPADLAQLQGLPLAGYLTKPLTREKVRQLLHAHFGYPADERYVG